MSMIEPRAQLGIHEQKRKERYAATGTRNAGLSINCKVCRSQETRLRFSLASGAVKVLRCSSCGFTFVNHVVDEDHLETSIHDRAGVPDADPACAQKWLLRKEILEQACGPLKGMRVLDVGAGGGGWLALARSAGAEVSGVEFCETCRLFAKEEFSLQLRAEPLEDSYWQRLAGHFDLVCFWDVLEHVNDPCRFLCECIELLAPGGKIMFTTPVRDTWFDRAGELAYLLSGGRQQFLLRQRYSHAHLQIFHSAQLRMLCLRFGLRSLYYRKLHELSFPTDQYFRNIYGDSKFAKFAAVVCGKALGWTRPPNKVIGLLERV